MDFIETQAAKAITGMVKSLDELKSRGSDLPVYRAVLTLPLTQGGITAVLGAIAERPSGWAATLQNTGGAGETFLVVAVDGVWRVWNVTSASGFIPLVSPAVAGNLVELTAGGALVDAGFTSGATGEQLVASATRDAARAVLGFGSYVSPTRFLSLNQATWATANVVGSFTAANAVNMRITLQSGATANSSGGIRINDTPLMINGRADFNFVNRLILSAGFTRSIGNVQGVSYLLAGKARTAGYGTVASGDYVGWRVDERTITTGIVCVGGVVTTVALSSVTDTGDSATKMTLISENGTVQWWVNGVLRGSTGAGPTNQVVTGTVWLECQNGATAADYRTFWTLQVEGW